MYTNLGLDDYSYGPAFSPLGLPSDPLDGYIPPGFEMSVNAVQPAPRISTAQSFWDIIKQDSQSALEWTENSAQSVATGTKNVVSSAYQTTKSALGTVVSDVASPVGNVLDNIYWRIIIAVVVIGGVMYFVFSTGGLKVNAII